MITAQNLVHMYESIWEYISWRLQNLKVTPLEKISLGLLKMFAYLLHPNKSVCLDFLQT